MATGTKAIVGSSGGACVEIPSSSTVQQDLKAAIGASDFNACLTLLSPLCPEVRKTVISGLDQGTQLKFTQLMLAYLNNNESQPANLTAQVAALTLQVQALANVLSGKSGEGAPTGDLSVGEKLNVILSDLMEVTGLVKSKVKTALGEDGSQIQIAAGLDTFNGQPAKFAFELRYGHELLFQPRLWVFNFGARLDATTLLEGGEGTTLLDAVDGFKVDVSKIRPLTGAQETQVALDRSDPALLPPMQLGIQYTLGYDYFSYVGAKVIGYDRKLPSWFPIFNSGEVSLGPQVGYGRLSPGVEEFGFKGQLSGGLLLKSKTYNFDLGLNGFVNNGQRFTGPHVDGLPSVNWGAGLNMAIEGDVVSAAWNFLRGFRK